MAEWENTALQHHVIFKIFYKFNFISFFHSSSSESLYRHKWLCEI